MRSVDFQSIAKFVIMNQRLSIKTLGNLSNISKSMNSSIFHNEHLLRILLDQGIPTSYCNILLSGMDVHCGFETVQKDSNKQRKKSENRDIFLLIVKKCYNIAKKHFKQFYDEHSVSLTNATKTITWENDYSTFLSNIAEGNCIDKIHPQFIRQYTPRGAWMLAKNYKLLEQFKRKKEVEIKKQEIIKKNYSTMKQIKNWFGFKVLNDEIVRTRRKIHYYSRMILYYQNRIQRLHHQSQIDLSAFLPVFENTNMKCYSLCPEIIRLVTYTDCLKKFNQYQPSLFTIALRYFTDLRDPQSSEQLVIYHKGNLYNYGDALIKKKQTLIQKSPEIITWRKYYDEIY